MQKKIEEFVDTHDTTFKTAQEILSNRSDNTTTESTNESTIYTGEWLKQARKKFKETRSPIDMTRFSAPVDALIWFYNGVGDATQSAGKIKRDIRSDFSFYLKSITLFIKSLNAFVASQMDVVSEEYVRGKNVIDRDLVTTFVTTYYPCVGDVLKGIRVQVGPDDAGNHSTEPSFILDTLPATEGRHDLPLFLDEDPDQDFVAKIKRVLEVKPSRQLSGEGEASAMATVYEYLRLFIISLYEMKKALGTKS